jgi:hypothetical protein
MPSNFENAFGDEAAIELRVRHPERYVAIHGLEPRFFVPFRNPAAVDRFRGATELFGVFDILLAQRVSLTDEQLGKFLMGFAAPRDGPIDGADILSIVESLYPLSATEIYGLIYALFEKPGKVRASFVRDLILGWVNPPSGGRMLPSNLVRMVNHVRDTADRQALQSAFSCLFPCTGVLAFRLFSALCIGEARLTGSQFCEVLLLLTGTAGGTPRYSAIEIDALVQDMCVGADLITAIQFRELIRAVRDPVGLSRALTFAEMRQLFARLRPPTVTGAAAPSKLTPVTVHALVATRCDRGDRVFINLPWILAASGSAFRGESFAHILNGCVFPGDRGFADVLNLLVKFNPLLIPGAKGAVLMKVLSQLGDERYTKMDAFLTEGAVAVPAEGRSAELWESCVFVHLEAFLEAGRAPHPSPNGVVRSKFAHTAYDGPEFWNDPPTQGLVTVRLFRGSLNSICNSHTLAHCDFQQRIDTGALELSFFGPTVARAQVSAFLRNFTFHDFRQFMNREKAYVSGSVRGYDFGLRFSGVDGPPQARRTNYSIDHLYPLAPAHKISSTALVAISKLFDLTANNFEP